MLWSHQFYTGGHCVALSIQFCDSVRVIESRGPILYCWMIIIKNDFLLLLSSLTMAFSAWLLKK